MIVAIDPGSEVSAVVSGWKDSTAWGGLRLHRCEIMVNVQVEAWLRESSWDALAIEWIQSYGMAVGASVFETTYWIGRFASVLPSEQVLRLGRVKIKTHVCGSAKAKDANIRQALIDRFSADRGKEVAIGRKSQPGPLYGFKSHLWAALAVAVTAADLYW